MSLTATTLRGVILMACLTTAGAALPSAVQASPHPSRTSARAAKAATVKTRKTRLGTILVGPTGRTLYLWEGDSKNHSNCSGACARVWMPLMSSGTPMARGSVRKSLLGVIPRAGAHQVTYAGHPLYYYDDDKRPGQTEGQNSHAFGADWYVVAPAGKAIDRS